MAVMNVSTCPGKSTAHSIASVTCSKHLKSRVFLKHGDLTISKSTEHVYIKFWKVRKTAAGNCQL